MVLSKRVEKLEQAAKLERTQLVHVMPGQTEAKALAAYKRTHGSIPEGTTTIFIRHTFKSAI